nr:TPA: hypothetical protein BN1204_019630 [Neospora caninum Liverpool]
MSPKKAGKHIGRGSTPSRRRGGRGKSAKGQRRTKVQTRRANVTAASFLERSRQEMMRYNLAPKKAKKSASVKHARGKKPRANGANGVASGGRPTHLLPVRATGTDEVGEQELWASLRAFDEENRRVEREREERRRKKMGGQAADGRETAETGAAKAETAEERRAGKEAAQGGREPEGKKVTERDWSQLTRNERRKLRLRKEQLAAQSRRQASAESGARKEETQPESERNGRAKVPRAEEIQQSASEERTDGQAENESSLELVKTAKRYRSEVLDDEETVCEKKRRADPPQAVSKEEKEKTKGEKNRSGQCPIIRRKGETYAAFTKRVDAWARESLRTSSPSVPAPTERKASARESSRRRRSPAEEAGAASKADEEEESRAKRPVFGEVVDRPPELKQYKDSFARFKAKAQSSSAQSSALSPASPQLAKEGTASRKNPTTDQDAPSGELSQAYVQQVRAAYATVKEKRHEKAGEAKLKRGRENSGQDTSYTRPGWTPSSSSLYDSQWVGVGRYKPLGSEQE